MKQTVERLIRLITDLLFPPRCVFCGEIIPPGTQVCRKCAKTVAPCGTVRLLQNPDCDVPCAALFPYEDAVRESMLRFKFHGEARSADYYARKLAAFVKTAFPDAALSLVTWVPLSEKRKKERGYDQAERIARPLARELGLPCAACLQKAGENRVQHLLRREERAGNVHGVYAPVPGKNAATGAVVLLVDDIVTTGATLSECAQVLLHSGASQVFCAAAAHADMERVEKSDLV